MPEEHRELPLFPLNTVLFPHMNLPLRIFEPRYRQMLGYCLDHDKTFGIVLIKMGSEVGEPATPYEIGTTAKIVSADNLEDGTIGVITFGQRRFHIDQLLTEQPYLMAQVTLPEEDVTPISDDSFTELRTLAQACIQHLLALNHQWTRDVGLPREQERFSYVLPTKLEQLDNRLKQVLLESPTLATRLGDERTLVDEEEKRLRRLINEEAWLTPNLN